MEKKLRLWTLGNLIRTAVDKAAGEGFAMLVPLIRGAAPAGAAEQYSRHDYVKFNDPQITLADLADNLPTLEEA